MKRLLLIVCTALAGLSAGTAQACFPVPIPLAERVRAADTILLAEVLAVRPMPADPSSDPGLSPGGGVKQIPEPYISRIQVKEALKGRAVEPSFDLPVPDCGAGSAPRDSRILAFKTDGRWYAMPYTVEIDRKVREQLRP